MMHNIKIWGSENLNGAHRPAAAHTGAVCLFLDRPRVAPRLTCSSRTEQPTVNR